MQRRAYPLGPLRAAVGQPGVLWRTGLRTACFSGFRRPGWHAILRVLTGWMAYRRATLRSPSAPWSGP